MSHRVPTGVFVLGTVAADVAATTRAINLLGVPVGQDPHQVGGQDAGRSGSPEPLREINERVLHRLGGSPLGPPLLEGGWTGEPALDRLRGRARAAFLTRHQTLEWVWGDPLLCLTLPLWRSALDLRPVVVLVHAEPSAASPVDGGVTDALAPALWERYTRAALESIRGLAACVTRVDALLADPAGWDETLTAFLRSQGLRLDRRAGRAEIERLAGSLAAAETHGRSRDASDPSDAQLELGATVESVIGVHDRFPELRLPPETPGTERLLGEQRDADRHGRRRRRGARRNRERPGGAEIGGLGGPGQLPDYLIIGAQKAGTSSLYRYIAASPQVALPARKELHFFDVGYDRGVDWYRSQFPPPAAEAGGGRRLTGEGSPYYLFHPLAPRRVKALLPDVKLLVLLRDPARRAVSNYHHEVRAGRETLPLEAALDAEPTRLAGEAERLEADPGYESYNHRHFGYLTRGVYVDQLTSWRSHFPAEQMLVIQSERLFEQTDAEMRRVFDFLGVPHVPAPALSPSVVQPYLRPSAEVEARLAAFFVPHNARLYDFLGEDLGW